MSDNDFMEEDEFDFEYSDADAEEDSHIDLENSYYEAKTHRQDYKTAIAEFEKVVEAEEEKGEWGFKALKQMVKLSFKLEKYENTLGYYVRLLPYTKGAVTRNASEKSINGILDYVSAANDTAFMEKLYSITLEALEEAKNDRLWTKTKLKLAKLWLDRKEHGRLKKILRQLYDYCDKDSSNQKGTLLLEIYALEIQMYTETKNNKRLKEIYQKCLGVKSAIPHPRIMGLIRECGGKMHMNEQEWNNAQTDFFEAFKNYDEAGSPQRIQCLKYLVLANMLTESQINPFDSQETKPYANDPQIVVLNDLVDAFHYKDIKRFERILRTNRSTIMDDLFIREYIDDVLKTIRCQVIQKLVSPYTKIEIKFIADHLVIAPREVEDLLISLILDGKISGKIDQIKQIVLLQESSDDALRYTALSNWTKSSNSIFKAVMNKLQ